ncbi:MAG: hypothetical protein AAFU65_18600, partial [Pseudomonadota bacterium]
MNRQQLISNGTVFGVLPLSRSLSVVGAVLVALFVIVKPEASLGLGLLPRTLFWVLHVGVGLLGLLAGSWLLLPVSVGRLPLWLALALSGLAAAAL